jgi:hypothetical protein
MGNRLSHLQTVSRCAEPCEHITPTRALAPIKPPLRGPPQRECSVHFNLNEREHSMNTNYTRGFVQLTESQLAIQARYEAQAAANA